MREIKRPLVTRSRWGVGPWLVQDAADGRTSDLMVNHHQVTDPTDER